MRMNILFSQVTTPEGTMSHRNPFKKSVGFYEVMATSYTTSPSGNSENSYTSKSQMEAYPPKASQRTSQVVNSSGKSSPKGVSVNFETKDKSKVENREKYLTAKYGAHQMLLIKKRLAVEMWVFEELGRLYCTEVRSLRFHQ